MFTLVNIRSALLSVAGQYSAGVNTEVPDSYVRQFEKLLVGGIWCIVTLNYRLSRWVHDRIFTPDTTGFHWMKRLYEYLDTHPGPLSRAAHSLEHMSKFVMYGCKDCGDCSLPEIGYLCPMISCSKGARNGPCGGSADGQCEMLDKQCIWARAYDRAKFEGESEEMLGGPAVFYNAQLKGTSAWANTFLGRDHLARKNGRPAPAPPESKKEN